MDWYVAFTKPQCEARVAEGLARIGVETYHPVIKVSVRRRHVRRIIERPLFPRYLFADGFSFDQRRIDGLFGFISTAGSPVKIAGSVVDEIRDRVAAGEFDVRKRKRFAVGMRAKILDGPFEGITGQVETANERRVTLLIECLSGRVPVSIAVEQLRAIP